MENIDIPARPQEALAGSPPACTVCGGRQFRHFDVIWPELAGAWRLSELELAYINRQQGTHCTQCGANVRSMALARAICLFHGHACTLDELIRKQPIAKFLEVNEAGSLHQRLSRMPGHHFGTFPQVDLENLAFPDAAFDLLVHSDTLEHVPDPMRALQEARRVLKDGGALVFTVPVVIGRPSYRTAGKPPSYHGGPQTSVGDYQVHTEFGADVWAMIMQAGFSRCEMVSLDYPAGIAIIARP